MKKTILQPLNAIVDRDRGCSRLWFDPEKSAAPTGTYQVAGGICWPVMIDSVYEGAAILAARNVQDGTVYVFEQTPFASIEPIIGPGGALDSVGLASWFVTNWAKYYAFRYYQFQHDEYAQLFRTRLHRCDLVQPKPTLISVHWSDDDHAQMVIADTLEQHRLKFAAGSILQEQIMQQQADPEQGPFPAVHALACLLTGLLRKRRPHPS